MTLRSFLKLRQQGTCNRQAGRAVGVPWQTVYRWKKRFEQGGIDGLAPRYINCGRRSAVAGVRFSARAIRELERLLVETGGQNAWQAFVKGPHCPPAVARLGLRSMPAPVARLVKLTPLRVRCKVSADGRRVYVQVNRRATK